VLSPPRVVIDAPTAWLIAGAVTSSGCGRDPAPCRVRICAWIPAPSRGTPGCSP